MKKIDKQKIRWGIESVEFARHGLMKRAGSSVRVTNLKISEKKGTAIANSDVIIGGTLTQIRNQTYVLDGLRAWINALCQTRLA